MRRRRGNIILLILLVLMEFGVLPEIQSIGFYCGDPKISHKYIGDTVTLKMLLFSTIILPLFTICGVELGASRRRTARWSPFHQSLAWYREYLSGYLIVFFLTCVSKVLVGEPRPHFLDTCKPYQAMNCTSGYVSTYYCTNRELSDLKVRDSSKSFPSGHASLSLYLFTYIAWYLRKRVVGMSAGLVAWTQVTFLTWALVCCLTRITDHRHHWWDVLAGSVLGVSVAVYTVLHFCCDFQLGTYYNLPITTTVKKSDKSSKVLFKGNRLLANPTETNHQGMADITTT